MQAQQNIARTGDGHGRVDQGKHHGQSRHPVVGGQAMVLVPDPQAGAHNGDGEGREDGADGDNGPPLGQGVDLGRCVVDPDHGEESSVGVYVCVVLRGDRSMIDDPGGRWTPRWWTRRGDAGESVGRNGV